MQVSIETLSKLERKMTVEVPAEQVENQVRSRMQEAARTVNIKGFRKGKVPVKVIQERYGKGVRQEVLGEVMSQSYYQALGQHKVKPAGQPKIEPKSVEEGRNLQFVATFEIYPEVILGDFSTIAIERKTADISDTDIDTMIETLRKQRQTWQEVSRAAQDGDQVTIDFTGTLNGADFQGGSAKGTKLVLGSKRMIDGFEAGLVGSQKGGETKLALTFPENYQNKELAGKPVEFAVQVSDVSEPVLPVLDATFFASFDVKGGGESAFRTEVKSNMARELKNAIRNSVKSQVVEGLLKLHQVELPKALVAGEVDALRQHPREVDGIDRRQAMVRAEGLVAEDFLERRLRVVERTVDRDRKHVSRTRAGHLALLERRDAAVGIEDKNRGAGLAEESVDRRGTGVARGGTEHVDRLAAHHALVRVEIAEELEREIFERERRSVKEFEDVEVFPERLQRRDRGIGERRVARVDDRPKGFSRNIRREHPHELEAEFRIG